MERLLEDLFKKETFQFIVFRSLFVSILVVVLANEYLQALENGAFTNILFTLISFFLIYTFYLRRRINGKK